MYIDQDYTELLDPSYTISQDLLNKYKIEDGHLILRSYRPYSQGLNNFNYNKYATNKDHEIYTRYQYKDNYSPDGFENSPFTGRQIKGYVRNNKGVNTLHLYNLIRIGDNEYKWVYESMVASWHNVEKKYDLTGLIKIAEGRYDNVSDRPLVENHQDDGRIIIIDNPEWHDDSNNVNNYLKTAYTLSENREFEVDGIKYKGWTISEQWDVIPKIGNVPNHGYTTYFVESVVTNFGGKINIS